MTCEIILCECFNSPVKFNHGCINLCNTKIHCLSQGIVTKFYSCFMVVFFFFFLGGPEIPIPVTKKKSRIIKN